MAEGGLSGSRSGAAARGAAQAARADGAGAVGAAGPAVPASTASAGDAVEVRQESRDLRLHFDLVDLRLIVNVAACNSLTGGAQRSCISLPAASTRIKHLEASIGARLLNRTPQGVTLTPPGQALLHHARLVLSQLEQMRGDLQEYARGLKGHLRMAASTTAITEFLPPVLGRYLKSHPDVSVDLRERLSSEIVRAVSDGTIDIGIVSGAVRTEGLQTIAYRQDALVLALPPQHPLAGAGPLPFVDTLAYDHVGLHEASAIHQFLQQRAQELNRALRLRIQVGNFEGACRMIAAGVGIGILPRSAAERHAQTLPVRVVALADDWAQRQMQVCVRDRTALPAFAADLIDLLIADAG
jgi:DNA-binding transcriptional LysR family regulator